VRKLCNDCKKIVKDETFVPVGCEKCMQTGFKGRVLIAEMVQLDGQLRKAILNKADLDELENILKSRGHMSMAHDGRRLVNDGITTLDEVKKVCGVV